MNPPYPGSSGDGRTHGPPPSSVSGLGSSTSSNNAPSNPFHPQSALGQLQHHGSGLHPLHGGAGSLLHGGPPPLPPPPLSSALNGVGVGVGVGVGPNRASPHHLPGSILHPPRGGLGGPGSVGVGASMLGSAGSSNPSSLLNVNVGGSNVGAGSLNVGVGSGSVNVNVGVGSVSQVSSSSLLSHPVRLQASSLGQGGSINTSSSMKVESSSNHPYSVRPPSPRRDNVGSGSSLGSNAPMSSVGVNVSSHVGGAMLQSSDPYSADDARKQSLHLVQSYKDDSETSHSGYYGSSQATQAQQNAMNMGAPPPRHRELRVEDALLYLDQVKQQFGDQPDIYNQFLDVMKDFKAQSIDTPGVIFRVSNLFRGYPNLILGFNTFLPPGYRIRPDTSIEVIPQQLPRAVAGMYGKPQVGNNGSLNAVHRPPPVTIPPPYSPPNMSSVKQQPTSSRQGLAPGNTRDSMMGGKMGASMKAAPKKSQTAAMLPSNSSQNQGAGAGRSTANPVEFDHAIHYVTMIKQRFAGDPDTYKEFLAILHTYQKEQRSIRQVLDQVSYLFREHPDLLREFTFFLPDAVQEQAKERLDFAADLASQRIRLTKLADKKRRDAAAQDRYGLYPDDDGAMQSQGKAKRSLLGDRDDGRHKIRRDGEHKALERRDKESERDHNRQLFAHKRGKRRSHDTIERRQFLARSDVLIDKEEWSIFEKIKKILPSRDSWREFLKCLELYSQEVLSRQEMLTLIKNLFGRHTELVDEFDHILLLHGEHKDPNEIWPFIPLAETDLSQCRRATPSYRGLPASFPLAPCSFRSKMEKEVCNDSWVSVPTGSEDFSFKHMRKNQYEEALFRCEDERYEIDMAIDANASTISILEPLAREIEVLKEKDGGDEKLWNYVVDKGTFRITHLCAISRIYGESGTQILELLRKYPAGAIPIILKRLRQKDEEWRKARQDLNKQWKEVNEENYHKSLDHSSFYFKQKDKKQTSMKFLVQEAKTALEADEKAADQKNAADANKAKETDSTEATDSPESGDVKKPETSASSPATDAKAVPAWKAHFQYHFGAVSIHKDAFGLLSYAAEKNLGHTDKEKISKVWQSFFFPFFQFEEEWLVRKQKHANMSAESAKSLQAGTEVSTDYGDGTVLSFDEARGVCEVQLPMGKGYLQLNVITMPESSDVPASLAVLDDAEKAAALLERQKSVHFGAQHEYVFLRLYQMLHDRLEHAFELCEQAKRNRRNRTINPAARALDHARLSSSDMDKDKTGDYQAFLSKLYALIDGTIDSAKYEDCCRTLMGSKSFFLFTMEKLVTLVLKQMQHIASDSTSQELIKMFGEQNELKASADATFDVEAYLSKTRSTFEGEGAFRMEFKPGVLRRTPLETPSTLSESKIDKTENKLWALSPRVRPQEPSKWLIEPELAIQYLGTVGDEDGDEDDGNSPNATPPETPVFGTPDHDAAQEAETKESKPETDPSGDESMVGASSEEEEEGEEKEPSKKRARDEVSSTAAPTVKRAKVDEEEKEEGEAEETEADANGDVDMDASDDSQAKASKETTESDPTSEAVADDAADSAEHAVHSPDEVVL